MKKKTLIGLSLAAAVIFAGICASASSMTYSVNSGEAKLITPDVTQSDIKVPASFKGAAVTAIGVNAFKGNETVRSVELPGSIASIEWGAFEDCVSLEKVNIPEGISWIEDMTFSGCRALKNIELPETIICIGVRAFYGTGLSSVKVPEGTQAIEVGAFENCQDLKSIEIPDSVIYIGENAFKGCDKLTAVCKAGSAAEKYLINEKIPYTVK